jgi:hypothetical protein
VITCAKPILPEFSSSDLRNPIMTTHTHRTAPTQYVETASASPIGALATQPACRSSSTSTSRTMDHWDPVTDGLAKEREVILFAGPAIPNASRC